MIPLDEMVTLKIQNAQLKFELILAQMNTELQKAQTERDVLIVALCSPFLPEGQKIQDYRVDLNESALIPIEEGTT